MRKSVVNVTKMEEGEFHPSKDVPDVLENGDVLTVYWTMLDDEIYTFVTIEDALGEYISLTDREDKEFSRPHNFYLYGALHDKVYPWQIELANLQSRLQCVVKANSLASAQVRLFDKAAAVMELIANSKKEGATLSQKRESWRNLAHIENLLDVGKMKSAWFNSRHSQTIERLMDGLLSKEEIDSINVDFEELQKTRRMRKSRKRIFEGQITFGF